MKYLLDSNICIYIMKRQPPEVIARAKSHAVGELGVSSISVAELAFGVAKSTSQRNELGLKSFLEPLDIAPFDTAAAWHYGELRAWLEHKGTPIGPLDTQIAAHALALDCVLVTNNEREFKRVPGLKIENWIS
jgi:tRNA(fMet)-specific endonuclease VapC